MLLVEARGEEAIGVLAVVGRGLDERGLQGRRAFGRGDGQARDLGAGGVGHRRRLFAAEVLGHDGRAATGPLLVERARRRQRAERTQKLARPHDAAVGARLPRQPLGDVLDGGRARLATHAGARELLERGQRGGGVAADAHLHEHVVALARHELADAGAPLDEEVQVRRLAALPRQHGGAVHRVGRQRQRQQHRCRLADAGERAREVFEACQLAQRRWIVEVALEPHLREGRAAEVLVEEAIGEPRLGADAEEGRRLHAHADAQHRTDGERARARARR